MRTITVLFLDSLLPGYLAIGAAMLTPDAAGGVRATNSCAVFFWRLPYFTHSPGVKQMQTCRLPSSRTLVVLLFPSPIYTKQKSW